MYERRYFKRYKKLKEQPIHRVGLTIVPVVRWEGPPPQAGPRSTAKFLSRCFDVLMFERLQCRLRPWLRRNDD